MSDRDANLERDFVENPAVHFRRVYDRYAGPLFRFLYRFTGNDQASEEILHDIFVELLNGRFQSVSGGTLQSWLFTVAKNRGMNHQKRSSKVVEADLSELPSGSDLEEQTIAHDLHRRLIQAEAVLSHDLKETWWLRKSGMDNQQIASALSIPLGTVKSRFARLVEYLRKEFEHES